MVNAFQTGFTIVENGSNVTILNIAVHKQDKIAVENSRIPHAHARDSQGEKFIQVRKDGIKGYGSEICLHGFLKVSGCNKPPNGNSLFSCIADRVSVAWMEVILIVVPPDQHTFL